MAIDPSIALGYRPPQLQMPEIQTPLERYAKVLSLQNLMRQGQLGDIQLQTGRLNLQQLQQGVQEKLDFANYLRNQITGSQQPQSPPQTMSATTQQPRTLTGATQFAPVQQPQDQTGTPLIGYDPATGTLPAQPPVPAPVLAPATPAPTAAPQGGSLGVQPVPGLAGLGPSFNYAEIATRFPLHGPQFIEQHAKAIDTILKNEDAKAKIIQDNDNRLSSLAQGIVDETTKNSAIATALDEKRITPAQRDYLLAKPWNDPIFNTFIQRALKSNEFITQKREAIQTQIAQNEENRKQALAPYQLTKAKAEAGTAVTEQELKEQAQDAVILAAAARQGPDALATARAQMDPTRAVRFAGLTTPDAILNRGSTISELETKQQHAIQNVMEATRLAEEKKKNAAFGELTPRQLSFIEPIARSYDSHPLVKDFNTQVTKYGSMKNLLDKKLGGPGDVAIIYDFMKALDPNSVVRESEYQAAAKSGNIFSGALARFNGYLKPEGGFLPDKMKQEFLDIVGNRMNVSRDQIGKIYQDYGRRIDKITGQSGTGTDFLTNYGNLYDVGRGADGKVPAPVQNALAGEVTKARSSGKATIHQLRDGSVWQVNPDGSITPATAPK